MRGLRVRDRPETGQIDITRFTAVDDVGRCINPMIVHGQTHGGAAQGIGQALSEICHVDPETGQPHTGSLMDYAIPRADTLPSFRAEIVEVLSPTNPLGIKAAGEGATTPAPAAVINAIVDALSGLGVRDLTMPATRKTSGGRSRPPAGSRVKLSGSFVGEATALKVFAAWLVGRGTPYIVLALVLALTLFAAAYVGFLAREPGWHLAVVLLIGFAVSGALFAIASAGRSARVKASSELDQAEAVLVTHRERLRILHAIDQAVVAAESPQKIAGAVVQRLRELLRVSRAIVNIFDLAKGEVEWLAAAGRHRTHVGPGVRYSLRLMGDVEALKRGDPQIIDTRKLPPAPRSMRCSPRASSSTWRYP